MSLIPWKWSDGDGGGTMTRDRDPFGALHQEINRVFDSFMGDDFFARAPGWGGRAGMMLPKADVSETDKEVHVSVELPGISEKDLDVELRGDTLRIHGQKKDERETKEHNFHRTERSFGEFERIIPLPAKVNRDGVDAKFKDGVLCVTLAKSEPATVEQKIPVHAGA